MVHREEKVLVHSEKRSSFLNKEMAIGWFAGLAVRLMGGVSAAPWIGAIMGSIVGKARGGKEIGRGKEVSSHPGFWNKDAILGAMIGLSIAGALSFAISGPLLLIAGGAATLVSTYVGGKHGQRTEFHEYQVAKARNHRCDVPEQQEVLGADQQLEAITQKNHRGRIKMERQFVIGQGDGYER